MPLPKPNKGESKNKFVGRCVSFATKEGMPQNQAVAACQTQWKKKVEKLELKFNAPITEFADNPLNKDFTIEGIAISATTTSNNHKFLSEELQKSASTLNDVPLLKDHNNSVDSIVGKVIGSAFNTENSNIEFKAIVNDPKAKELIQRGDLNTVSVGAIVSDIEEEDGVFIPKGIIFKELSLVAVPADSNATFQIALKEAYQKSHSLSVDSIELKGGLKMEEKNVSLEVFEEYKKEISSKIDSLSELLSETLKKITEKEETKEADVDEEPKEPEESKEEKEPEESEKSEESKESEESEESEEEDEDEDEEEDVAEEKDYNIVQSKGYGMTSFTVVRK